MNYRCVLGIAVLLGGWVGLAPAGTPPAKPYVEIKVRTILGKIMLLDATAGKLTVRVNDLAETITVGPDCKFGSDVDGLESLAELRRGEMVIVSCRDEQGRLLAHRITRLNPKKAKPRK